MFLDLRVRFNAKYRVLLSTKGRERNSFITCTVGRFVRVVAAVVAPVAEHVEVDATAGGAAELRQGTGADEAASQRADARRQQQRHHHQHEQKGRPNRRGRPQWRRREQRRPAGSPLHPEIRPEHQITRECQVYFIYAEPLRLIKFDLSSVRSLLTAHNKKGGKLFHQERRVEY